MRRSRIITITAMLGCVALIGPSTAFAQRGGGPGGQQQEQGGAPTGNAMAQQAQVGAGTTDGTTTGSSGPQMASAGGPPPPPDASLCDSYQGVVQQSCLYVVLEQATPPNFASGG